jgi:hypothetical protein
MRGARLSHGEPLRSWRWLWTRASLDAHARVGGSCRHRTDGRAAQEPPTTIDLDHLPLIDHAIGSPSPALASPASPPVSRAAWRSAGPARPADAGGAVPGHRGSDQRPRRPAHGTPPAAWGRDPPATRPHRLSATGSASPAGPHSRRRPCDRPGCRSRGPAWGHLTKRTLKYANENHTVLDKRLRS